MKQLFSVKKKRKSLPIIGCEVQMGKVSVGSLVKVLRFVTFLLLLLLLLLLLSLVVVVVVVLLLCHLKTKTKPKSQKW